MRILLSLFAVALGACSTTPELVLELGAPELATTDTWVAITGDGARHDVTVLDRETRADGTWHVLAIEPAWCQGTGYVEAVDAPTTLRFPLTPETCGAFAPDSGKHVLSIDGVTYNRSCVCSGGRVWCRDCSTCGWYRTSSTCS